MRRGPIFKLQLLLVALLLAADYLPQQSQALVNLQKFYNLTKEEFFELDRDVSKFYIMNYWDLDPQKPDYDMLLHRALRAYRHTVIMNHFDYRFGDAQTMDQSRGPQVNDTLCLEQLEALYAAVEHVTSRPVNGTKASLTEMPISLVNFFEAWARTEAGVLNGNTIWFGSYSACVRAKIPPETLQQASGNSSITQNVIRGRYCVGHLKAKSWPESDLYFEDRISIKTGMCLPDSCHSKIFMEQERVREIVNSLTRIHMLDPFNQPQRYNITYIFCLPDEDSPMRQLNTGARLFLAFVGVWFAVLLFANWRYQKRKNERQASIQSAVDIRLAEVKNLPLTTTSTDDDSELDTKSTKSPVKGQLDLPGAASGNGGDTPRPSPLTSDIDEFTETLKEFVQQSRRASSSRRASKQVTAESLAAAAKKSRDDSKSDFASAFSIESNLSYLLRERSSQQAQQEAPKGKATAALQSKMNRRLSSQSRRLSASTSDLSTNKDGQAIDGSEKQSKYKSRVNIDIFDGIKAISTIYIVSAHVCYVMFEYGRDLKFLQERMIDPTMTVIMNGSQTVGLFYIITGILLTYLTFVKASKKQISKPSFWLFIIISRYLRLMPVYALVFWFAKHVAPYTGSGADWMDYRADVNHVRGYCNLDSWWTTLTMSSADTKLPYGCLPQSWYLSNDFRSMLVLPIYLVILAKNQTAGYVAIFATFVYSYASMWHSLATVVFDFREFMRWGPHLTSAMSDKFNMVYMQLSIRISTYLYGVLIGHLLYRYERGEIREWPLWLRKYGYKVSFVALSFTSCIVIICSNQYVKKLFPPIDESDPRMIWATMLIVKAVVESCLVAILILTATGHAWNWITSFLSGRTLKILSNVSYAVFCVHFELIFKAPGIRVDISYFWVYIYSLFYNVYAFIIGILIHVLYEMPINNLLRYQQKKIYKWVQAN